MQQGSDREHRLGAGTNRAMLTTSRGTTQKATANLIGPPRPMYPGGPPWPSQKALRGLRAGWSGVVRRAGWSGVGPTSPLSVRGSCWAPRGWTPMAVQMRTVAVHICVGGREVVHEVWLAHMQDPCIIGLELLACWGPRSMCPGPLAHR